MARKNYPIHLMNWMLKTILQALFVLALIVFSHMLLTKPADAGFVKWPSTYIVQLLRQTTAEDARNYLGINIGEPSAAADAAEVQMDDDYIYFAVDDNKWVRVAVEAVWNLLLLENGESFLLENGSSVVLE